MSHRDDELDSKVLKDNTAETPDSPCSQRRRLLAMLGVGIATAYVAPTLFSVGQAQAWDNHTDRHGSYSRHKYSKRNYSKNSYSRASYSQLSGNEYRGRERDRLREYRKDPVLILEDVILGPPRR